MTAAQAAKVILDGVRAGGESWSVDAEILDRMVREIPEEAYEPSFMERFVAAAGWKIASQVMHRALYRLADRRSRRSSTIGR
jgi:hypothetical protein